MKKVGYNVAVLGATGVVGQEMVKVLEDRRFPVKMLKLLASERSAGMAYDFRGETIKVEILDENSFKGVEIGLFSAGGDVSEKFAPIAVKSGCIVIDNTSFFRMNPEVPLVVPEVNPHAISKHNGIIANPNCSTIQMVLVLKPIHDVARIKRVVVSTYQSTSGAGKDAMDELFNQTLAILNQKDIEVKVFPYQIAFNCIPHIDVFLENGYTKEEMKIVNETVKIMDDETIKVTVTTVRVPVFIGHSESVNIETHKKITVEETREILKEAPGVKLLDNPEKKQYPLPILAAGKDEILVGRIRQDFTVENGLNLWIVSDNLRKGAALNAVQIAEILIRDYM